MYNNEPFCRTPFDECLMMAATAVLNLFVNARSDVSDFHFWTILDSIEPRT